MMMSYFLGKKARVLFVCLFSLALLVSLCLTVGAITDEENLLTLDPNEMALKGNNENFAWEPLSSNYTLTQVTTDTYTGKVLSCRPGIYWIYDTNNILPDYEVVTISADFYFDSFPSGTTSDSSDITYTCDPNGELPLMTKSVLSWAGNYDGLRIDSEGNLYSSTGLSSALGAKLEKQTWHNIQLIYSKFSDKTEIWLDGKRIATTSVTFRKTAHGFRFFDGRYSYTAYVKNINISASDTPYRTGIVKEESSDFLSYQTTKPAADGSFKLRIVAGVNSLMYDTFGYKVLVLTKDEGGNTVSKELVGTDNKAYSSFFGGSTKYSIQDTFGYPYACLATVENLDANSDYTELVIFPYTVSSSDNKIYGTPISLVYTGAKDESGYPLFSSVKTTQTKLLPTDDTYISGIQKDIVRGAALQFDIRNVVSEASDKMYRAAYFKFTIPKATVDRLDSMVHIFLNVNIIRYENDDSRDMVPLAVFGSTTDWEENTLTYNTHTSEGIAVRDRDAIATIPGEDCTNYIKFNVLNYVKEQAKTKKNDDGSLTVSFCIAQEDGHENPRMLYIYSKENGETVRPFLSLEESLYGHSISNIKSENLGYEPISYAEKLVDTWFNELYPKLYLDENGEILYHDELGSFDPTGYAATEATGDFTHEVMWKSGTTWYSSTTPNKITDTVLHKDKWNEATYSARFARTLSTLGTSTANDYLKSAYANTTTEYDSYGGITNMGFKGTATGFFHTEKHTDGRTYIIDPLGNPYFAASVNTVVYGSGDTGNQRQYILDAYGTKENFFTEISSELRDMGINTAFVSSSDDLLAVSENGLAVTVSAVGIGGYMGKLGRSQVSEGVFPNNNTINVFDPDFITYVNLENKTLIETNGYAKMDNLFAYTADNELPSGLTILERYLTIDPSIPENIFSYQTAWAWLARRLDKVNPTTYDLQALSSEEYNRINSEFLGFVYATYYRIVGDSLRAADPNHMYIGSRVNGNCPYDEGYLRAAGHYLDIIAINLYGGLNPVKETISGIYKYSGKPFIVTEFFAKGLDTLDGNGYPLANSTGAGILVFKQEDRAAYYEHYVLNLLEAKSCVGWVWYRFRDNDQSLWTVTADDGTVYENVRFLSTTYGENPVPNSLMLEDGTVKWLSELYSGDPLRWKDVITQTYTGEALASNQNVNKGFYNNNFSSVVTVYTYNADGTLRTFLYEDEENTTMDVAELLTFGSKSYEVNHPESANLADGTVLTSTDGLTTFTVGKEVNADGSYTITELTVYKGRYIALTDSIKTLNDNLVGLIGYLDNN